VKKTACLTRPPRVLYLLLALAAIVPASCSKKTEREPVFQVSGKLVDGGNPAGRALMMFHPLDGSARGTLRPVGKVAADGSFRVSTYTANDGAPPGQYAVTVVWPKIPTGASADETEGPDQLEGRCNNPKTSPWHFRVEQKANDLGTLDLQSWPKPSSPEPKTPAKPKPAARSLE